MTRDDVQDDLRKLRAVLEEKWPSLTDEDLEALEHHKDVFLFRLQRRVGGELDELEREFDALVPPGQARGAPGVILLPAGWGTP